MLKGYQLSLQDQEQDEGAPSSQSHDTGRGHLVRGNTKLATDHIQVSGVNWHRFAVLGGIAQLSPHSRGGVIPGGLDQEVLIPGGQ